MNQSTAEQFIILIHHPEKSRYLVSHQVKNVGIIGSLLLDLSAEGTIELESGKLKLKSTRTQLSSAHKKVLEQIEKSTKTRKIKTWIARFSQRSGKYQKELYKGLASKGYFRIEPKKFLFIPYYKTYLTNVTVRSNMVRDIRDVIFYSKQVDADYSMILSLIEACKMYKVVCSDRSEIKVCKVKLKEINQANSISDGVDKVIKEMQAAVIASMVITTTATTVTSH